MGKGLGINSRHFVRFGVWLSAAKYQKLRAFKKTFPAARESVPTPLGMQFLCNGILLPSFSKRWGRFGKVYNFCECHKSNTSADTCKLTAPVLKKRLKLQTFCLESRTSADRGCPET